jgi:acetyl-CoA carboxylase carboxyl transferase subunit alpha
MQHAYYSVISPEGCAAILWKSAEHASKAANALRLTSQELLRLGLIDAIVEEPRGGAHRDPARAASSLETWIGETLRDLRRIRKDALLKRRYERLRKLGSFFVSTAAPEQPKIARSRARRAVSSENSVAAAGAAR